MGNSLNAQHCLNLGGWYCPDVALSRCMAALRVSGPCWKCQPGLFCPLLLQALELGGNVLRKRATSLQGVLLDSHLQLQPGCFAMSLEKAFIPGRIEEWNAPCQQGCG